MMFHYKLFKLLVICTLFGNSSNCAENHLKQSIPESVSKPADIIQHMQNLARYLVRELSPEAYTYNGNEHYALMNIHFGRLVQAQSTEKKTPLCVLDLGSCQGGQARWIAQYLREHHNELPKSSVILFFNITGEKEIKGMQQVEDYSIAGREIVVRNYLDFDIEHLDTEIHKLHAPAGIPFGTKNGDEKFDLIMSQAMLPHLITPLQAFINATNLLKPGGLLIADGWLGAYIPAPDLRTIASEKQNLQKITLHNGEKGVGRKEEFIELMKPEAIGFSGNSYSIYAADAMISLLYATNWPFIATPISATKTAPSQYILQRPSSEKLSLEFLKLKNPTLAARPTIFNTPSVAEISICCYNGSLPQIPIVDVNTHTIVFNNLSLLTYLRKRKAFITEADVKDDAKVIQEYFTKHSSTAFEGENVVTNNRIYENMTTLSNLLCKNGAYPIHKFTGVSNLYYMSYADDIAQAATGMNFKFESADIEIFTSVVLNALKTGLSPDKIYTTLQKMLSGLGERPKKQIMLAVIEATFRVDAHHPNASEIVARIMTTSGITITELVDYMITKGSQPINILKTLGPAMAKYIPPTEIIDIVSSVASNHKLDILQFFTNLIDEMLEAGRAPSIILRALGPIMAKYGFEPSNTINIIGKSAENRKIPMTTVVMDIAIDMLNNRSKPDTIVESLAPIIGCDKLVFAGCLALNMNKPNFTDENVINLIRKYWSKA